MKLTSLWICAAFLALVCSVFAEPVPKILSDGMDLYKKDGAAKALAFLLAGSPVENNTTAIVNQVGNLNAIESAYGKFLGYETVGVVSFSKSAKRYYLVMLYEKGPFYSWFEVYSGGGKEIITSFDCNTKVNAILPDSFFQKQ